MKYKTEASSGGIVYKKEGNTVKWLITQHSQNKHWSFPKGLIGDTQEHEKMEEAALREVQEEGGIEAKIVNDTPINVSYKYKLEDSLVEKTVHYFLMEYVSGDPQNHDWEVSEAKFVPSEEVMKTVTFQTDREAFEKVCIML